MNTDRIFTEGQVVVDDAGFIHGPLQRLNTGLGLFACEKSWDFHGMNMDGYHARLVRVYEPPLTIPRAIRDGSMVAIRWNTEVAEDISNRLSDLACWLRGYRAGLPPDERIDSMPLGYGVITDLNVSFKSELRKISK